MWYVVQVYFTFYTCVCVCVCVCVCTSTCTGVYSAHSLQVFSVYTQYRCVHTVHTQYRCVQYTVQVCTYIVQVCTYIVQVCTYTVQVCTYTVELCIAHIQYIHSTGVCSMYTVYIVNMVQCIYTVVCVGTYQS